MPVRLDGSTPEPGTQILLDGKDAGTIRSAAGDRGLALIRLEALDAARAGAALMAGQARVTPEVPAWMRLPAKGEAAS